MQITYEIRAKDGACYGEYKVRSDAQADAAEIAKDCGIKLQVAEVTIRFVWDSELGSIEDMRPDAEDF